MTADGVLSGPSPDDMPILDETIVVELAEFGLDFLGELADAFDGQLAAMDADIDAGLSDGDAERERRAAHLLKGSAATIGLARAAAWAGELETYAKAGDLASAAGVVGRVRQAVAEGTAALHARLTEMAP
jgi:HPt (histidine-containing phosphotransfer) domain-containing protein